MYLGNTIGIICYICRLSRIWSRCRCTLKQSGDMSYIVPGSTVTEIHIRSTHILRINDSIIENQLGTLWISWPVNNNSVIYPVISGIKIRSLVLPLHVCVWLSLRCVRQKKICSRLALSDTGEVGISCVRTIYVLLINLSRICYSCAAGDLLSVSATLKSELKSPSNH